MNVISSYLSECVFNDNLINLWIDFDPKTSYDMLINYLCAFEPEMWLNKLWTAFESKLGNCGSTLEWGCDNLICVMVLITQYLIALRLYWWFWWGTTGAVLRNSSPSPWQTIYGSSQNSTMRTSSKHFKSNVGRCSNQDLNHGRQLAGKHRWRGFWFDWTAQPGFMARDLTWRTAEWALRCVITECEWEEI